MEPEGQHAFSSHLLKNAVYFKTGKTGGRTAEKESMWTAMDPCGSRMYRMCGCGRRKLGRAAWKFENVANESSALTTQKKRQARRKVLKWERQIVLIQ